MTIEIGRKTMQIYFCEIKTNNRKTYDYIFGAKIYANRCCQNKNEHPRLFRPAKTLKIDGDNI